MLSRWGRPMILPDPPAVLVVEDDDGDFLPVEELLADALPGSRVVRAPTLAAALAELPGRGIGCALLDLGLPDAAGLDALARGPSAAQALPAVLAAAPGPD